MMTEVVMTPSKKGKTTVIRIEKVKKSNLDETQVAHMAGGQHSGLVINKQIAGTISSCWLSNISVVSVKLFQPSKNRSLICCFHKLLLVIYYTVTYVICRCTIVHYYDYCDYYTMTAAATTTTTISAPNFCLTKPFFVSHHARITRELKFIQIIYRNLNYINMQRLCAGCLHLWLLWLCRQSV